MKAQDLKNSILQMAMEGKLVPQDPNDEPASVLLERIKDEKKQLIKEKKIKRNNKESVIFRKNNHFYEKVGKNDHVCINDEIPFDIPDSWQWCRLENIVELINGDRGKNYPAKSKLSDISGIPFISAINLKNGKVSEDNLLFLNQQQYDLLSRGKLRKNDLIFCLRGSLGKNAIFNLENGAIASSLVILRRYSEDIFLKYLFNYINSNLLNNEIKKYDNGTAQPNLSATNLKKFFVPIPPLIEQKRIVKKIEELLPLIEDYDRLEEGLNKLNNEFPNKIRDSILQDAMQGKLVPQNSNDEPATLLLERIKEEKEKLIKEKKIKRNNKESFIFKENNHFYEKIGKKDPICIDEEIPFEIPESWEWCRLESLGKIVGGGTPKTSIDEYWSGGEIPWLTPADMKFVEGKYVCHGKRNITKLGLEKSSARLMPKNSIIYSSRAPIGYIAVAKNELCTNQGFKSLVPFSTEIVDYVYYCLIALTKDIQSRASGTTFKEISGSKFGETLIPLPPINEQKRIVEKIDNVLNFIKF